MTDDGEILFSFPPNWKSLLFQRSFARRVKLRYEEVSPVLSAGFRATFGIILITSIVFITIVLSSASTSSSENDNNKSSSNGGNIGLQLNLHDIMQSQNQHRDSSKMSFLDSCYSYLFGDADPNEGCFIHQSIVLADLKTSFMIQRNDFASR